jgi:YHS domain-containing protein
MNVIARFVRFVIWVLVLSWVFKLIGKLASWALRRAMNPEQQSRSAAGSATRSEARNSAGATESFPGAVPGEPQMATRHLVRDPICGMHLAETLAIPYRDSGELVHFCSAECRDKYASGILRRAANA